MQVAVSRKYRVGSSEPSANSRELFQVGIFAQGQAECRAVVVFGQGGLEIGCGDMVWASLVPRHCMKRLLLKRSIIPRTNIALLEFNHTARPRPRPRGVSIA